jgi:hypothetical protein
MHAVVEGGGKKLPRTFSGWMSARRSGENKLLSLPCSLCSWCCMKETCIQRNTATAAVLFDTRRLLLAYCFCYSWNRAYPMFDSNHIRTRQEHFPVCFASFSFCVTGLSESELLLDRI